jgi:transcriptional regulator with GAF, ATPase, and Fis domain
MPEEYHDYRRIATVALACRELPALQERNELEDALRELNIFVGSAALRHAAEQAAMAAGSEAPVLLRGETGSGKELFARLIHRLSWRRSAELVPVNCAAIPKDLVESFLFGHKKGAFTGAVSNQTGKFEQAHEGTLFLDSEN